MKNSLPVLAIGLGLLFGAAGSAVSKSDAKGGSLGIYLEELEPAVREALDVKEDGVLIEDVVEDGPAYKAGLKPGDILINVDGNAIKSSRDVYDALDKRSPQDKVKVVVLRKGIKEKLDVVLGEPMVAKRVIREVKIGGKGAFLGVYTEGLDGQLAEYFQVESGALVKSVVEDSPASKAGIKAGDVIIAVGDEKVEDQSDLIEALAEYKPGDEVTVEIVRKGEKIPIKATLGERTHPFSFHWGDDDEDEDLSGEEYKYEIHRAFKSVDWDAIGKAIQDALEKMEIRTGGDELREDLKQLKEELQQLKKEIKQQMDEMRAKRDAESMKSPSKL